jgi:hypothetical protein
MLGEQVTISQMTAVDWRDGTCIAFDVVADVAADAQVTLQLDAFDDGSVEYTERFPTASWRKLSYRVRFEDGYQGLRFRVTKRGGRAVLANLSARTAPLEECAGQPVALGRRPDGALCSADAECSSSKCVVGVLGSACGACKTDADCTGGQICGLAGTSRGHLGLYATCVAPGSALTNAACNRDAQCATGMCDDGACGVCDGTEDCGGAACVAATYRFEPAPGVVTAFTGARHCAAGAPKTPSGGACVVQEDCASGRCQGLSLGFCRSSLLPRRCTTDAECPGFTQSREPQCIFAGISGGVCQ